MQDDEARQLLGLPSNSRPTLSQISEAYSSLQMGTKWERSASDTFVRVVRTGEQRMHSGRSNHAFIKLPFLFLTLGTVTLGGLNAARAYQRQKELYPSHNPFLP